MLKQVRLSFLTLLALSTTFALAQTPAPSAVGGGFDRIPAIVLSDLREAIEQRFNRMDQNQDGVITKEEYESVQQVRAPRRSGSETDSENRNNQERRAARTGGPRPSFPFMARGIADFDTNEDGKIELSEMTQMLDRLAALDSNSDGEVSPDEIRGMREAMAPREQ